MESKLNAILAIMLPFIPLTQVKNLREQLQPWKMRS
jgi:hypothetical protein